MRHDDAKTRGTKLNAGFVLSRVKPIPEVLLSSGHHESRTSRNTRILGVLLLAPAVFMLAERSRAAAQLGHDAANNAAARTAVNTWWKYLTYAPPPVKAGTVKPASTFTFGGRIHKVPKHVQTRKEYEEEVEDARYWLHF